MTFEEQLMLSSQQIAKGLRSVMRTCLNLATGVLCLGASSVASAHPGHGNPDQPDGLLHLVSSPVHLGSFVIPAAAVAIAIGCWRLRKLKTREMKTVRVDKAD